MTEDKTNPSYYKCLAKCRCGLNIELIDIVKQLGFIEGNIVKYIWRYKQKNGREDLLKARWLLTKLLDETQE